MDTKLQIATDALIDLSSGDEEDALKVVCRIFNELANYFGLSGADRDDIIQDALIDVWESYHTFTGEYKYAWAWFKKILKNRISKHMAKKEKEICDPFSSAFYDPGNDNSYFIDDLLWNGKGKVILGSTFTDIESDYIQNERCLEILDKINSLKDNYKDTMNLYISGHTREEVAEIMNKPVSDISNYHKRARNKLRESLENKDD